jgi:hypothetical protein
VGVGVGVGLGDGVGVAVGVGVGEGVAVGFGVALGLGEGLAVGSALAAGSSAASGVGVTVGKGPICSISSVKSFIFVIAAVWLQPVISSAAHKSSKRHFFIGSSEFNKYSPHGQWCPD